MTKCLIPQEYVTVINIYALNIRTPKYIKQRLREETMNNVINMIINILFSTMNKSEK